MTTPEPIEAYIGEVFTPGGDNSNPPTVRIARGDRIGWQDQDGTVHTTIVEDFDEFPRGSGGWTFVTRPEVAEDQP